MTPEQERQRELDAHRVTIIKAEHAAARDADREAQRLEVEAEAQRFAIEHAMVTPDPIIHESPLERWRHLGGLTDPEGASKLLSDPAKRSGVQVVDYETLALRRAAEDQFFRNGGGRYPGQQGPAPIMPQRPRLSMEWLTDADVIYDAASLALIAQAQTRRPA
jgi:hypothetical protein